MAAGLIGMSRSGTGRSTDRTTGFSIEDMHIHSIHAQAKTLPHNRVGGLTALMIRDGN